MIKPIIIGWLPIRTFIVNNNLLIAQSVAVTPGPFISNLLEIYLLIIFLTYIPNHRH